MTRWSICESKYEREGGMRAALTMYGRNETAIPSILTRHGFNAEEVLDEVNYPLLELDAPAICADRLDYGIRDSHSFGFLTLQEAAAIQKDLTVSNKQCFAFKSADYAKKLCLAYMQSDNAAWSNEQHSALYQFAVRSNMAYPSKGSRLITRSRLMRFRKRTRPAICKSRSSGRKAMPHSGLRWSNRPV